MAHQRGNSWNWSQNASSPSNWWQGTVPTPKQGPAQTPVPKAAPKAGGTPGPVSKAGGAPAKAKAAVLRRQSIEAIAAIVVLHKTTARWTAGEQITCVSNSFSQRTWS